MNIEEISMMQFRASPGEWIDQIRHHGKTFVLTRAGKQVAIVTGIPEAGKPTCADVPIEIHPDGAQTVMVSAGSKQT